jgi:hypothetical protein
MSQFIAQHAGRRMDLDVEYKRGKQVLAFRVVVLPGNEPAMTRLCTNLPRTPFSLDLVSRLYRFRWQIFAARSADSPPALRQSTRITTLPKCAPLAR